MRLVAGRRRVESAVDDELQHHLAAAAEYWESRGLPAGEARDEASRRFGNPDSYRAECIAIGRSEQRRQTMRDFIGSLAQDVRFAFRGLGRYPGFAASVVLTLALGIGASTAIFTVVDATMLRPVAFPRPHELVEVSAKLDEETIIPSFSVATLVSVRGAVPAQLAASSNRSASRTDVSPPEFVTLLAVEPAMFGVLGIRPVLGRLLASADLSGELGAVIVLSHSYWRSSFGADRNVLGRTLRLDGIPFTIVGVLGDDANYSYNARAIGWVPLRDDARVAGTPWVADRLEVIGRLPEGQSVATASSLVNARVDNLVREGTVTGIAGLSVKEATFSRQNPDVRRGLLVLMAAVGCLWLIAVVNGTNLFLVRNAARDAELGVRLALGASRRRIVRQILIEAVVLALVSGVVAVTVAGAGITALRDLLPSEVISFSRFEIRVTERVQLFVFAVSVLTGLLFGVAPAIRAARRGAGSASMLQVRTATRDHRGFRNSLVVGEIALAVALLVGAGLLTRSFARLSTVETGFDAAGVLAMSFSLPEDRYSTPERRAQFRDAVLDRLRSTPGVVAATEGGTLPAHSGFSFGIDSLQVDDGRWVTIKAADGQTWIASGSADEQYFDAMRIPIVAGRAFTTGDRGRTDVVIIDRQLAATLFPGSDAVGRQIRTGATRPWQTIVGVAGDALLLSPVGSPDAFFIDEPQVAFERYLPYSTGARDWLSFAVRVAPGGPDPLLLRTIVADLDPLIAVRDLGWLEQDYADTIAKPRFNGVLMAALAGVSLLLTLVGVFGVLSFTVAQRTRELGIRMALGAPRGAVQRAIVLQAVKLGTIGVALGFIGANWMSNALRPLLFQVSARDTLTYGGVAAVMLLTAAVAAFVPSRRATRVDPVLALRSE
jgi:predicted permease